MRAAEPCIIESPFKKTPAVFTGECYRDSDWNVVNTAGTVIYRVPTPIREFTKAWSKEAREAALAARKAKIEKEFPKLKKMKYSVEPRVYFEADEQDEIDAKVKKVMKGMEPEEAISRLGDEGARAEFLYDRDGVQIEVNHKVYSLSLTIDYDGVFRVQNLVADSKAHGAGMVREKGKAILELAEDVGADSIGISAGLKDGAYSWARMGFEAEDDIELEMLKSAIYDRLSTEYMDLPEREDKDLLEAVKNAKSLREIASWRDGKRKVGKELLRWEEYRAVLHIKEDNPGYRLFKRYIGK